MTPEQKAAAESVVDQFPVYMADGTREVTNRALKTILLLSPGAYGATHVLPGDVRMFLSAMRSVLGEDGLDALYDHCLLTGEWVA